MKKIYLNTLLEAVIESNSKVKDMFDLAEDKYESKLSFNDLQLWYLDIIEMNLSNYLDENQLLLSEININQWLFDYLHNYLTVDIAC